MVSVDLISTVLASNAAGIGVFKIGAYSSSEQSPGFFRIGIHSPGMRWGSKETERYIVFEDLV